MFVLHVVTRDWLKWISKLASSNILHYLNPSEWAVRRNARWLRSPLAPGTVHQLCLLSTASSYRILQWQVWEVVASYPMMHHSYLWLTLLNVVFHEEIKKILIWKTGHSISWSLYLVVSFLLAPLCKWTVYLKVSWVLVVIPWLLIATYLC